MEEKQKVELTLPNPLNIAVQVPGLPGKDGKSAYEVAVEQGFVGTVDEWLERQRRSERHKRSGQYELSECVQNDEG